MTTLGDTQAIARVTDGGPATVAAPMPVPPLAPPYLATVFLAPVTSLETTVLAVQHSTNVVEAGAGTIGDEPVAEDATAEDATAEDATADDVRADDVRADDVRTDDVRTEDDTAEDHDAGIEDGATVEQPATEADGEPKPLEMIYEEAMASLAALARDWVETVEEFHAGGLRAA